MNSEHLVNTMEILEKEVIYHIEANNKNDFYMLGLHLNLESNDGMIFIDCSKLSKSELKYIGRYVGFVPDSIDSLVIYLKEN